MPVVLPDKLLHFSMSSRHGSSLIIVLRYILVLLLASFLFAGCTMPQEYVQSSPGNFRILPKKYEKKALDCEARGQLPEALQSWEIVLDFRPNDLKIKERINSLSMKIRQKAGEHFSRGEIFYRKGQVQNARREFLLTLAYDPDNSQALDYVENKLHQPVLEAYTIRPGDTVRKIADKEFGDPNKAFLLAFFNHIASSGRLTPGTSLQIPLLDKNFPERKGNDRALSGQAAMTSKAKSSERKNRDETSISAAYNVPKTVSKARGEESDSGQNLVNYRKAKEYLDQEEYAKSLKMLLSIDINYRDVRQLIASTEVFLQQEADAHYRKGISYFLSGDLDKAIAEWEEVLRLTPSDLRAKKDLQNARRLRKRAKRY